MSNPNQPPGPQPGFQPPQPITQEMLLTVQLADQDAMDFGEPRVAADTCLSVYIDAGGERWTCFRRKGHAGHHVDPSIPMPDVRRGRYPFHRWAEEVQRVQP